MKVEKASFDDIDELRDLRLAYLNADSGPLDEKDADMIHNTLPDYFRSHLNRDLFAYVVRSDGQIVSCAFLLIVMKPMSPAFINGKTATVLNVLKIVAIVTIAFDEEADGRSIGDLTKEEISGMVAQDTASLGEHVEFSEAETAHGTKLLVYNILDEEEARFEIYTLYKGYQVGCVILPGQGQTLTEELLKMAVDFLSGVWITE